MKRIAFLAVAMLAAGSLQAQARYTCRAPNGSVVISDPE